MNLYLRTKIHMVMIALVLIGTINWGTTTLGYNLVEIINDKVNTLVGSNTNLNKIIYFAVALSGLRLLFKKSTWLPFLGYSAFPTKAFVDNKNNSKKIDVAVKVQVRPNTRVAYWASLPKNTKDIPKVEEAYGDYSNSGVVTSDSMGNVELKIITGTSYIVPSGRTIPRHIHYREIDLEHGMMGDLKTVFY